MTRCHLLRLISLFVIYCSGCGTTDLIWNPFELESLLPFTGKPIRIAIADADTGVFDTNQWAFIKRESPWGALQRDISVGLLRPVKIEPLKPFQIAAMLKSGRCQYAIISQADVAKFQADGLELTVLARGKVLRRQGVLVAGARTGITSLADIKGKQFAFGPRRDPVLFFAALKKLDEAGVSPSDIQQEFAITGFEGALQNHISSREAAKEIVYRLGTPAGIIEASEYDAYPDTGGIWLPLLYTFSKNQFVELGRTDVIESESIPDAVFVACASAKKRVTEKVRRLLLSLHNRNVDAVHALGFARFESLQNE